MEQVLARQARKSRSIRPSCPGCSFALELFVSDDHMQNALYDIGLRTAPRLSFENLGTGEQFSRVARCIFGWVGSNVLWAIWIAIPACIRSEPSSCDDGEDHALCSVLEGLLRLCYCNGVAFTVVVPRGATAFKKRSFCQTIR